MKSKYDILAIDAVVNLWTPEANSLRPKRDAFYQGKMKVERQTAEGIGLDEMLRRMDAAGIERAFLVATRAGRLGHPACYHLPYELVARAVKQHPDRFHGNPRLHIELRPDQAVVYRLELPGPSLPRIVLDRALAAFAPHGLGTRGILEN